MKSLRIGLLTAAAVLGLGQAASAADIAVKAPPMAVATAYNWTGVYFGVHTGGGWSDVDLGLVYPFGAPPSSGFGADSWVYGGHVGLQYQFGQFVLGGELSLTDGFATRNLAGVNLFGGALIGTMNTSISPLFMATARFGYAWDRWHGYVKGGYALADFDLATNDFVPPFFVSNSRADLDGWTVGLGIEYALTNNFILGLEYNHVELSGSTAFPVTNIVTGAVVGAASMRPDASIDTLLLRASVKLGPW